jgi:ABC-type nitrate/sulfonate/bicarbonate transport system substrate-binding protein
MRRAAEAHRSEFVVRQQPVQESGVPMHSSRRLASGLVILLVLLASVVIGACGSDDDDGGGESGDQELTRVDFQLSWLPGGDNLGFWAGEEQGFFEDEGIDLNIRHSNDPTASIKLAASGERPMAIAYTGDILFSAAKGNLVKSVYTLTESSPFGVIALGEAEIDSAEDLAGKRVGVTSLPTDQAYFAHMLEQAGVDKSEVDIVDPGQAGIQQVIQGNLDATSAIVNYEPAVLENEGIEDYSFVFYSDYGAPDAPFYCIVVNPAWLEENGDVVEAFIRATRTSFDWTDENVDEAAELFVQQFPEQDPELVKAIWEGEAEIQGNGENDPAQWDELAEFFEAEGLLDEPVDTAELYTNDYQ